MPMLKIDLTGGPELAEMLKTRSSRVMSVLSVKLNAILFQMQSKIVAKLSGEILHVRSGVLRASVHTVPAEVQGSKIIGGVESAGGPAMYGKFQEFGSHAHQILSVKKRALSFLTDGQRVYARSVQHPGTRATAFMSSTLAEEADLIRAALEEAVNKIIAEK
jgi:hypothetical protein